MVKRRLILVEGKNHPKLRKRRSRREERTIIIPTSKQLASDFSKLQATVFYGCNPGASLW